MKQAVRLMLLTIALAAVAAAAWIVWTADRQLTGSTNEARQFQAGSAQATAALGDLRAAQQSYVAADQGDAFWSGRVAALVGQLNDRISVLKASSVAADASTALDEASTDLQNFVQVDRRALELTRAKQLTAASDLIYSDGFDQTKKTGAAIGRAVDAEFAAQDAAGRMLRQRMAAAACGAAAVLVLITIALTPVRRQRLDAVAVAKPSESATSSAPLDLHLAPTATPDPPPAPSVDLAGIATLCVDLARVSQTSALPALLSRASDLVDASGLVVWIADPDGRELFPTMVHGYPAQIVNRLGTLPRDAENVTASAFRTGLLQIVKATASSQGAIAAPLVGPTRTLGVMAAEMRHDGEQQETRRAAVAILAAQIATLVGPPSARAGRTEAAG